MILSHNIILGGLIIVLQIEILLKLNYLEELSDEGCVRSKEKHTCTLCNITVILVRNVQKTSFS